jgi:hypothetical protein
MAAEQVTIAHEILDQIEDSLYRDCLMTLIDDQIDRDV